MVRIEAIPIKHDGQVVAVMTREQIQRGERPLSEMELMYMSAADELIRMVEEGLIDVDLTFPSAKEAGDGLLKVDSQGVITYASPNAVMIYKRLGEQVLVGRHVDELELNEMPIKMALQEGKASEREITERSLTILKRAIPLLTKSEVKGAIAIVRDISDIKVKEQQLRIKEATIKEIHHRVKNNLQTIASLLRLQARRLSIPEAREALLESVGRISSIAAVHEVLSQTGGGELDFIGIVESIITMVEKSLIRPDKDIEIKVVGESGLIPAPVAASLALITTELLQNAVEHAFKKKRQGRITVEFKRGRSKLSVKVSDNGVGLPPNFKLSTNSNLGLQIVETLVCEELHGSWRIKSHKGTEVVLNIPIAKWGD
jgi:two-component sensor histidine kinase